MLRKLLFLLPLPLVVIGVFLLQPACIHSDVYETSGNLTYPKELRNVVQSVAASFPAIEKHEMTFRYDESVTSSVMQAQPQPYFLFEDNSNRSYVVKMRPYLTAGSDSMKISELPPEVLSGWLSHELGHIQDYLTRDKWDMIGFALKYLTSQNFIMNAESRADSLASLQGRAEELIQMKRFIQTNDLFEDSYKIKISNLYPDTMQVLRFCEEK